MFPQRDLQARGIAVLDHTNLQQPDSKLSVDLGITEGCQGQPGYYCREKLRRFASVDCENKATEAEEHHRCSSECLKAALTTASVKPAYRLGLILPVCRLN